MKRTMRVLGRLAVFLVVYPIFGAVSGTIVAHCAFRVWGDYDLPFAAMHGVAFGVPTGLFFALLAFPFLHRLPILKTCLQLMLGTCLGGMVGFLNPVSAWFMGMMGFWFALVIVVVLQSDPELEEALPDMQN